MAGFVIPAFLYFWFIHSFGVNTVIGDEWEDVGYAAHAFTGSLHLSRLWAPWSVERLFFPRLVIVALAYTTHLNAVVEMYVSAVMLVTASFLILAAHKRRAGTIPWLWYCPAFIVLLSVVAYGDTLWGFQIAWYMIFLSFAIVVFLLDRERSGLPSLLLAMVSAVVGSYSSFQGLLIWPVGLFILYHRRHRIAEVAVWLAAAVATTWFYFVDFFLSGPVGAPGLHHPFTMFAIFFSAVGDVVGIRLGRSQTGGNSIVVALGAVMVVVALWTLARHGLRRDSESPATVGLAMILFGLLWDAAIAASQLTEVQVAFLPRFRLYNLLIPAGLYLVVLPEIKNRLEHKTKGFERSWRLRSVMQALVLFVLLLQVTLGAVNGVAGGRVSTVIHRAYEDVAVNEPRAGLAIALHTDPFFGGAMLQLSPVAEHWHLGPYGTANATVFRRIGLEGGSWRGSTRPHVYPGRVVAAGSTVRIEGRFFAWSTRHRFSIAQCSVGLFTGDPPSTACQLAGATPAATDPTGRLVGHVTVRAGPVGDGSCVTGKICFVAVLGPALRKAIAFSEIDVTS